jgi:ubiquinol oxidase
MRENNDLLINTLTHEAENERMHLVTFLAVAKPTLIDRGIVHIVQGVFFVSFASLYILFPKLAHRVVGYLEEEAVVSYTEFLKEIDKGTIENVEAPEFAIKYWNLTPDAKLRDVVLAVRSDEAQHRDMNHFIANEMKNKNF